MLTFKRLPFGLHMTSGPHRAILFNILFWTPFWLVPALVLDAQPANNAASFTWQSLGHTYITQLWHGVGLTAFLAVGSELAGPARRYFFLAAGLCLWFGAALSIVFLGSTGIAENTFTILTGMVFATKVAAGLSYITVSWKIDCFLLATLLPFVLLAFMWNRLEWKVSRPHILLGSAVFLLPAVARIVWEIYSGQPWAFASQSALYFKEVLPVRSYVDISRARDVLHGLMLSPTRGKPQASALPGSGPLTIIVVVGESTNRNHMSLYGYCRETNPNLSRVSGDLFVMRNVISEIPLTIFALSHALRVPLLRNDTEETQTALDVFGAAGFDTYWISNQFDYGGDPVSLMTNSAMHHSKVYRRSATGSDYENAYDGALVNGLRDVLAKKAGNRIVFLHSMGSHWTYADRYPHDVPEPRTKLLDFGHAACVRHSRHTRGHRSGAFSFDNAFA
jgi:heptose-I-phosphate ethanolaminephosphotransferase